MSFDYMFKYIIVGDASVGKSCILLRFTENRIRENYDVTIGVEFGAKAIDIDSKTIKIQIWDTSGQENFRSLTKSYYRSAICCILVYDITERSSFDNIDSWFRDVQSYGPQQIQCVLVGNKIDLESKRKVSREEGARYARDNDMLFYETSAKENRFIEALFTDTAKNVYKRIVAGAIDPNSGIGVRINADNENKNKLTNDDSNSNVVKQKDPGCSC